jgi:hypothetical protein
VSSPDGIDLRHEAGQFAHELTETVRALAPDATPFRVSASDVERKSRVFVRQDPSSGIILNVNGSPLLRLVVSIQCTYDHREQYLAVEDSKVAVLPAFGSSEPLFRYEYLRNPTSGIPCAHLQVHAHRDALTFVMARSGSASKRGQRRKEQVESGEQVPSLSELHLPLGGARFRPCLEDILEMLVDELGVDAPVGASEALADGRATWRRKQLGAAVRDCPEVAARTLADLGYTVATPPEGHPPERLVRLTSP